MSPGRRDVLRVIAGATMYAAAGSLRGSSQEASRKPPTDGAGTQYPTNVVLNGSFGLEFADTLICFLPLIGGHVYSIDNYPLNTDPNYNLELKGIKPQGKTSLFEYQAYGLVYLPEGRGFPYDPTVVPHVKLSLPYPAEIYPHRLFNIGVRTGVNSVIEGPFAGALVLSYPPGDAPSIQGIQGYNATLVNNQYYKVAIRAYNPTPGPTMTPDSHAHMSWAGLSTHFKGMNSELVVSGYSQLKAPNFPNQISDDDIEKDTVATEIRRHNIPEPLEWVFYTAANCKSPGFVANG